MGSVWKFGIVSLVAFFCCGQALAAEDEKAAPAQQAANPFVKDALKVWVVGSGGPFATPNRTPQSVAVLVDGEVLLFDTGPGSSRAMAMQNFPQAKINHVFFTHYHSDHMADFGEVRSSSRVAGRATPLNVYGPPGLKSLVDGYALVYAADDKARFAHHGPEVLTPASAEMVSHEFALPGHGVLEKIYEKGDVRVFAITVDHSPVESAVGYRVEYGPRSIFISGDTAAVPQLALGAANVDLFLADGLGKNLIKVMEERLTAAGNTRMAKLMSDIPSYHMAPAQAAKVAAAAKAKKLVLVHVTPPLSSPEMEKAYLAGVAESFNDVVVATDGMTFVLNK